jgi:hypothetical protein
MALIAYLRFKLIFSHDSGNAMYAARLTCIKKITVNPRATVGAAAGNIEFLDPL